MHAPAPFTPPLRASDDSSAWLGGLHWPARWYHNRATHQLDASSVHILLHHAGLPRAELVHMGAPRSLLDGVSEVVGCEVAVPLLGRIAWDALYGDAGGVWSGELHDRVTARRLGEAVVAAWFS